jgi:hypothetical protein
MAIDVSRRNVLKTTCAIGAAVAGASIIPREAPADTRPADGTVDRFFRDDSFGEPWRTPQVLVLIHGALESGIVWYAWVPALAKEYRVLRPDLPGCGLCQTGCGLHSRRNEKAGRKSWRVSLPATSSPAGPAKASVSSGG